MRLFVPSGTDKEESFPKLTDSLLHIDKASSADFRRRTFTCLVTALSWSLLWTRPLIRNAQRTGELCCANTVRGFPHFSSSFRSYLERTMRTCLVSPSLLYTVMCYPLLSFCSQQWDDYSGLGGVQRRRLSWLRGLVAGLLHRGTRVQYQASKYKTCGW